MTRTTLPTPTADPVAWCDRVFNCPNDPIYSAILAGAIEHLRDPENWRESEGGLTVDETLYFMDGLIDSLTRNWWCLE